jgi:hypothetical protein
VAGKWVTRLVPRFAGRVRGGNSGRSRQEEGRRAGGRAAGRQAGIAARGHRQAGGQAQGGRWLESPWLPLTVEDGHGLGGDACIGVHLLQHLEQVDFVAAGGEGLLWVAVCAVCGWVRGAQWWCGRGCRRLIWPGRCSASLRHALRPPRTPLAALPALLC